jgi:hypothetical protein
MEIEEAFRHAIDGDAVLFLGAGFSLGAVNKANGDFPLANDLSKHLMRDLGESDEAPLQTSSEIYIKRKYEVGLLTFLNQHLGVKSVGAGHRSFAKPNWRRIYTTNYDDVFERAAKAEAKEVRTLALTPRIPNPEKGKVDCIHINGFLPWADPVNLNSTLILSETAYLTNRFMETPWASLFRTDIEAARAVIFAGYSVADLHIGSVLIAVESLRKKSVFIVGPNPTIVQKTTLEKFGTISAVPSVANAATILDEVIKNHRPAPRHITFRSLQKRQVIVGRPKLATAQEVFDLFVKGEIDAGCLSRSLSDPKAAYAIERAEIGQIIEAFGRGAPVVVVLSRLANGKSFLSECIATKIQDQSDVFVFSKETPSLNDEIRALHTTDRPSLIIIDDYARHVDLVKKLRLGAGPNLRLLLTSRTPTHLTMRDQLQAVLGEGVQMLEFRIDTLTQRELLDLDSVLAGAGLLGDAAALSTPRRVDQIYQQRGAGEFGSILLWLLESEAIRKKLEEIFSTLKGKGDHQKVIIAAMILTHIGQQPDLDEIADFIGASYINKLILSEDSVAANLIRLDHRRAYPRSSLFAAATLRALWDEGHVSDVLEGMLRRAWEWRFENANFKSIGRDLMRYSKVRQIVPQDNPAAHVRDYYERIRNMPACVNNEHFWLQFSLADIELKQFALADEHLKQSYAIASKMTGYNTFQLDNVKAAFLLARETHERKQDRALRSFIDASSIVNRQMNERRHAYYPFRVASRYLEFWQQVAREWSSEQRGIFLGACRAVLKAAEKVDPDLAVMDEVRQCAVMMRRIVGEGASR